MKTGLFFGSFNPIRAGHMTLAIKAMELGGLDEVWFVVSPLNPHKSSSGLAGGLQRLDMVNIALKEMGDKFLSCDEEFKMPTPSYTIDTINNLKRKYPEKQFSIIMGADNLSSIKTWKNYEELLLFNNIITFKRPGIELETSTIKEYPSIKVFDFYDGLSSTYIRSEIKAGRSAKFLVVDKVIDYIKENKLYL